MIELTDDQLRAIAESGEEPLILIDPKTQTQYRLVRTDRHDLLNDPDYDDSPWTAAEREALAWEAGRHAGWEDMDEYDCLKAALELP